MLNAENTLTANPMKKGVLAAQKHRLTITFNKAVKAWRKGDISATEAINRAENVIPQTG